MTTESQPVSNLRPYQLDGVRFLSSRDAALLADEMGLGKTVQAAVALLLNRATIRRTLLIAPASICLNWQRELEIWAPGLSVRRVSGDTTDRAAAYRLPVRILIAHYEQIRSDFHKIATLQTFDLTILDEAQRIKNASSTTALACRLIPRKRAWALSGTPLENRPSDFVSIFRFLKPGLLHLGMTQGEMHRRITTHFLRRTKKEVLPELPPIIHQRLDLELRPPQRDAYEEAWNSRFSNLAYTTGKPSTVTMLAVITRLKQICNFDPVSGESAKLEALRMILDEVTYANQKVLVFSQFVETLVWISKRIDIPNSIFHGGLTQGHRDSLITAFRQSLGPRALLVSFKAGGVGLNLQEASLVILFDQWWNPAVENQAINRAHRFGKTHSLQVIRLTIANSIESNIQSILSQKRQLFESYIEGAPNASIEAFLEGDLRQVLQV